ESGMRLDRWFKVHFPDLSFGHLQKLMRSGQVRVDGGRVKTSTRLEAGQAVRIPPMTRAPEPAPAARIAAQPSPGRNSPARLERAARRAAGQPGKPAPAPVRTTKASGDEATLRSWLLYEDDE